MAETTLSEELQHEYHLRFAALEQYRRGIWKILTESFFQKLVGHDKTILDLGCGWGEFINQIQAARKYGMDLNPESRAKLDPSINFIQQDCSQPWPLEENSLDCIFTSNFFEHLPNKDTLAKTLIQAHRCLKPGGILVCLGPNVKYLAGEYWDFWDHYLPLTELSMKEGLTMKGFQVIRAVPRFLPYTMVGKIQKPAFMLRLYLHLPVFWPLVGKQFLVVARKPLSSN